MVVDVVQVGRQIATVTRSVGQECRGQNRQRGFFGTGYADFAVQTVTPVDDEFSWVNRSSLRAWGK